MLLLYEDKIFWGRSLYYNLSLTSKRGESCKRRMRSPLRYGILSPTSLLAAFTETVVSLLHHPSGCPSLLLPSGQVQCLSSPLKAGLASQTISKLTWGKKSLLLPKAAVSVIELNYRGVRQAPVHQENKMEGYRVKVGCEIGLNVTKPHSLSPEVGPAARDVCSNVWTSASPSHGGSHNQIRQVLNSKKFILQPKSFRTPTTSVNHKFNDVRGN